MNSRLTRRIMRRIYFVYALRMVLNPMFLKVLIAFVFFWRSTAYISYANVLANAPQMTDIPRNLVFMRDALVHTEVTSAVLVLGTIAVLAWLASDFFRKTRQSFF